MSQNDETLGVAILAAGASRRMGSPKALLPWRGTTILAHLLGLWRDAGAAQIAVVFDPQNLAVVAEMDRLQVAQRIPNLRAEEGMMSSLQAAASWPGWRVELSRLAIALVDQPHVAVETVTALADFSRRRSTQICQPQIDGERGHPIILPRADFTALADTAEPDLRAFIRSRAERRAFMDCADRAIISDLDTPEDYRRIWSEYGSNPDSRG